MKKIINKGSIIFLFILIIFLNIGTILICKNTIQHLEFSKCLFILGIIALILYIINKIMRKEKIKIKDIFIILLLIFGFISYVFAYKKDVALNGAIGRHEGLKTLFSYYAIFLLSSTIDKKWQKRLLLTFVGFGLMQILLGTFQNLKINNILGYDRSHNFSNRYKAASGTFGNPNIYSSYILMCLLYIWYLLVKTDKNKILNGILFILFWYGLIIGNTSSCILSAILIMVFTLIKKINRQNIKKISIKGIEILVLSVLFLSILNIFTNKWIFKTIKNNTMEIVDIFKNGITDKTGNYRIYVWKESLKKVPKYYKTGIGIDNFGYLNDGFYICSPVECFDKAHNEYIQILLTEGVFTLIVYLSFLSYVLHSSKNKGILYMLIGYLIQALFNISSITVAPIFYMIMGFGCSKEGEL